MKSTYPVLIVIVSAMLLMFVFAALIVTRTITWPEYLPNPSAAIFLFLAGLAIFGQFIGKRGKRGS